MPERSSKFKIQARAAVLGRSLVINGAAPSPNVAHSVKKLGSPRLIKPFTSVSPFADAHWIWPDSLHWNIHNCYALFRKVFELQTLPSEAPLFITADQSYQLFINGRFVCRGPARGFQAHWPYDEIDVHTYLKQGGNVVAIRAYNPGYSNFQYQNQGYAGLLLAANWNKFSLRSDASWRSIRQISVARETVPVSMQLFSQEHIDLRKESGDWTALDFDDHKWISPAAVIWNSAPWFELEPRNIPMLTECEYMPVALIGVNEGVSVESYATTPDVVAIRYLEDRSHRPVQVDFTPVSVIANGKGKFRSYLFDFGKTVVGNLTLQITNANGGEIVDTYHTETIDQKTLTPDLKIPTYCRMAFGDRLICRSGSFIHHFYHYYGFRYLCITVRDIESDFELQLKLNWVGYPLDRKGQFRSSDSGLQKIWEACAWTQQCCSLDAYVDTPWREQAQWWGDARVQGWNTFHLNGDTRLFRRGLSQIASQTTPDGVTYGHAPTMGHSCILPDFTLIWLLTLWDYFWQTGSVEPLLTHHATVQKTLEYFRQYTDPSTGLIKYDKRFWLFLDWTDLFKDGIPTVYNLWLLIALDRLALLYRKAKKPHEAKPLEKWALKLRMALGRLINDEGLILDGFDWKGRIVNETSIHSQTLALTARLRGINSNAIMNQVILPYIRQKTQPKANPSAYWVTYIFSALIEQGYSEEVVLFIKNRWLHMAEHGTTWENFHPTIADESFSHAWSAHPLYHLMQTVGGLMQTGVAWSTILFRPVFHGSHSFTQIPSPHGLIQSEWKKVGNKVKVKLHLPPGVKAQVELAHKVSERVSTSSKWTITLT